MSELRTNKKLKNMEKPIVTQEKWLHEIFIVLL